MLRNITFSADASLIQKARAKAHKNKQILNILFRQWLASYIAGDVSSLDYPSLMKKLKHVKPGKHYSRDELNER